MNDRQQRRQAVGEARMRLKSTAERAKELDSKMKGRPLEERQEKFREFWAQVNSDIEMLKSPRYLFQDQIPESSNVVACPFYGKAIAPALQMMTETNGNQCALITEAHSPCRMEMRDQAPVFENCELKGSARALEFAHLIPQKEPSCQKS